MGVALESVLEEVQTLLADKVVVGCSIHSDLKVLGLCSTRFASDSNNNEHFDSKTKNLNYW